MNDSRLSEQLHVLHAQDRASRNLRAPLSCDGGRLRPRLALLFVGGREAQLSCLGPSQSAGVVGIASPAERKGQLSNSESKRRTRTSTDEAASWKR